ncbi:MAG: YfhO family protein [Oscillospiraceae bacterium]|nr:YfhO family protein [Oscillospiraceae bacterium]
MAIQTTGVNPAIPTDNSGSKIKNWFTKNYMYLVAFFLPVVLVVIAYANFDIYPFGKEGSVLALDLNGQYIYYFEAIRDAFWGDGSFFYNWSRDLSGEFMGIIGYYLASPFTLIPILLPRTMILESIMIMQLCKLGTAGLTFSMYVRKSKNIKPVQSIMFSTAYAMMAYAVIQTIDPMWLDGIVFLPLVVLGIEYFIDDGRKVNYIIPLAIMFVANFYIGFMLAIFTALYYFYYLFFGTDSKLKASDYVKKTFIFGLCTAVVLMCSAFMILPIYNALSLGKFEFSGKPDYSFATQFSPIELVPCLFPNQYYSVNMHGKPEIYCGMITTVLLPLFYMNKDIKWNKKVGYSFIIAILFFSMYIKPADMMWHGGQTPNWLPYRYSFLMSFVLVSMAATTFSKIEGLKLTTGKIAGVFIGILALVLYFDAKMPSFNYVKKGDIIYVDTAMTFIFGMILAGAYLIGLFFISKYINKTKTINMISGAMTLVISVEACVNALDSFKKIDEEVAYSNRTGYYGEIQAGRDVTKEIEKYDTGLYRSEKTFFRCVNDNLAYGLKGISHSSSVMNTKIINFIGTMGYSMRSYVTRYDGNTILADSMLGIKYVIDDNNNSSLLNPYYEPVFSYDYIDSRDKEKKLTVYRNPDALSIGYMIDNSITNLAFLGNDNPFNSQNMFLSTSTGNTDFLKQGNAIYINGNKEYYTRLETDITTQQITISPYGDQTLYTANADAIDPIINIHFTAESSNDIYMYLKTENEKAVNTWISSEKGDDGQFTNHKSLGAGAYFENHNYSIVRVGSFEPGTEVEVRLTVRLNTVTPDTEEYTIIRDFQFYEFHKDLFDEDIAVLKQNQWNINNDTFTDRYIEGTIEAKEGQIMLTSIPTEPGWTVKVDGKKVNTVEILKAFIGIELEPGTHTITMKYTPPGFNLGIITLILGIAIIIFLFRKDRVIVNQLRENQRKLEAEKIKAQEKARAKANKLIKSKGAVSNIDISEIDKATKKVKSQDKKPEKSEPEE